MLYYLLNVAYSIPPQGFYLSRERGKRYIATGTSGRRSTIHVWVSKPEPVPEPPADPVIKSPAPSLQMPPENSVKALDGILWKLC